MYDGHHLGAGMLIEGGCDLIGPHHLTEVDLDPYSGAAVPLDDLRNPLAKEAVNPDHYFVTRLDHVADGRLHPRHPCARERDGQFVLGLKKMA